VAPSVTSHNQKQQHTQTKHQTQTPPNRRREVVHTAPKTTTNKQKTTLQPNTPTNAKIHRAPIHNASFRTIRSSFK
jgi:3-oxoacyl-[acyl-carrier-protein] synthase III